MDMVEIQREIRRSVDTGSVTFGLDETEKNVLKGNGQLIIVSDSAPRQTREKARHWSQIFNIPVFEYRGKGLDLGSICGKPFSIGTMLVLNAGKSKVLEIGLKLNVDYSRTWSCYRGHKKACGQCPSCVERRAAFKANNIRDPLEYCNSGKID